MCWSLQGSLHWNCQSLTERLPVQEQIGQDGSPANQQGTGIILRRKKRDDSSPSKVGDTLVIADMVQRLCQVMHGLRWKIGMAAFLAEIVTRQL